MSTIITTVKVSIIVVGLPECKYFIQLNPQLSRRFSQIRKIGEDII